MMSGLNNDWVLWGSLATIAVTFIVLVAWAIRAFMAMEGKAKE